MFHQSLLRDCRAIVMWGDHQHGFRAGARGRLDLSDGAARALLTCTDNETKLSRNCLTGSLDHLKVLALVEIDALTGRTQDHVAADAGLVPVRNIGDEPMAVEFLFRCTRQGYCTKTYAEATIHGFNFKSASQF